MQIVRSPERTKATGKPESRKTKTVNRNIIKIISIILLKAYE